MKKSSVKIVLSVASLMICFGLGYLCSFLPFNQDNNYGSITKAAKYHKSIITKEVSAFQEKIMNDKVAYEKTQSGLEILSSRLYDFDNIVNAAIQTGEGIDELSPSVKQMKKLAVLSANAKQAANDAMTSFASMYEGDTSAAMDYDAASQILSLAYFLVGRQMPIGKEYVSSVDSYLAGKDLKENVAVATSRDVWAGYCATQAVMDGNKDDIQYWGDKKAIVNSDLLSYAVENDVLGFDGWPDILKAGYDSNAILESQASAGFGIILPFADLELSNILSDVYDDNYDQMVVREEEHRRYEDNPFAPPVDPSQYDEMLDEISRRYQEMRRVIDTVQSMMSEHMTLGAEVEDCVIIRRKKHQQD